MAATAHLARTGSGTKRKNSLNGNKLNRSATLARQGSFSSFKFFHDDELDDAVPQHLRVRDDILDKLDCRGDWQRRRLMLTEDRLYIALSKAWFPQAYGDLHVKFSLEEEKWRDCYSVLRSGFFECYDEEEFLRQLKEPFLRFNVLNCKLVEEGGCGGSLACVINLMDNHGKTVVYLKCESVKDMKRWMKVLKEHGKYLIANEQVEIVDSIPTEEIIAVSRIDQNPFVRQKNLERRWSPFRSNLVIKSVTVGVGQVNTRHNSAGGIESLKEAEDVEEIVLPGYSEVAASRYIQRSDGEVMEIQTVPDGYNSGRTFFFYLPGDSTIQDWVEIISSTAKERRREYSRKHMAERWQQRACALLDSMHFQSVMAALIFANFFLIIAQTQIRPAPDSPVDKRFQLVDFAFTILFTIGEAVFPCALSSDSQSIR
eukprot:763959-Hanusia_phi.AAC.13